MRWISVDEKLPEPAANSTRSKAVLIWCEDNRCSYTAVYDHNDNHWSRFGGLGSMIYHDITHWMPLPPPPEPEQKVNY